MYQAPVRASISRSIGAWACKTRRASARSPPSAASEVRSVSGRPTSPGMTLKSDLVAGVKRVFPCKPEVAQRHSGYLVGGTSTFGTRKEMPVYLERSVLDLPRIYINGGRRGYLLGMDSTELTRVLAPVLVDVALEE